MPGHPVLVARMADPDAHPAKIRAEMAVDRAQAIVPRRPAALLHLDLERGQIELVVKHRERSGIELEEAHRLGDAAPAFVHEGHRL